MSRHCLQHQWQLDEDFWHGNRLTLRRDRKVVATTKQKQLFEEQIKRLRSRMNECKLYSVEYLDCANFFWNSFKPFRINPNNSICNILRTGHLSLSTKFIQNWITWQQRPFLLEKSLCSNYWYQKWNLISQDLQIAAMPIIKLWISFAQSFGPT